MSVADIDAVLPQTQCRQCGFDGCRPYATAIAEGRAEINQCPPGGEAGIERLAAIVGRLPMPLNTTHGMPKPLALAWIDESLCIGCTLCIQACPVDAIVGGAKRMHDVVPERCTGCELCLPPCPVDCIVLVPAAYEWNDALAAAARSHHDARANRLSRHGAARASSPPAMVDRAAPSRKQAILDAAIERARLQRIGRSTPKTDSA